jgi:hypothetical protein
MDEMQTVLNAPDLQRHDGIRDRAMLHLCFSAGLRVSELVNLPINAIEWQPSPNVRIMGKGRRERLLPLWKQTCVDLRAWLAVIPSIWGRTSSCVTSRHLGVSGSFICSSTCAAGAFQGGAFLRIASLVLGDAIRRGDLTLNGPEQERPAIIRRRPGLHSTSCPGTAPSIAIASPVPLPDWSSCGKPAHPDRWPARIEKRPGCAIPR